MKIRHLHPWDVPIAEAREIQERLRERLVLEPPAGFAPRLVAGADLSIQWKNDRGYAGIVTLDADSLETVEESTAVVPVTFPYVPGFLSFRELPPLAAAWEQLERRPDAVIFDGHGIAHPRRFGLACHGGVLLDVPSVGCAKSLLIGEHGPLGEERGATAEITIEGEVVGMAVRTRDRVKPVYVSPGHRMDLPTAVSLVLRMGAGFREPETTRRAHRLVKALRRKGEAGR
ncbi:MAG TPA: deoxyribonuclease V [Longimicrobiales bacterium]